MSYTTIEQSKRLIEIGLDPETADATNHDTPAWTLDRLIELLPKELYNVSIRSHYYKLHFFWGEWRGVKTWYVEYYREMWRDELLVEADGPTLMDAVINMHEAIVQGRYTSDEQEAFRRHYDEPDQYGHLCTIRCNADLNDPTPVSIHSKEKATRGNRPQDEV